MTDPFRDGMQAALARTETLEDENDLLRAEIERLRVDVVELREHAQKLEGTAESRALANDARSVLDRLEAASRRGDKLRVALDRSFTGAERPLDAVSAAPAPDAGAKALLDDEHEKYAPVIRPPPDPGSRRGWILAWIIAASLVSFVLGVLTAVVLR